MKKSKNLTTLIFALLTVISAITYLVLALKDGATLPLSGWIVVLALLLCAVGMWICSEKSSNKMFGIIPVVALMTITSFIVSSAQAFISSEGITLPTTSNFEVLNLMLTITFIVAMVFAFKKGSKWAVIVAVVYSTIMLSFQAQLFLLITTVVSFENDAATTILMLPFVFAYATQVAMFSGIEPTEKPAQEEPKAEPVDEQAE